MFDKIQKFNNLIQDACEYLQGHHNFRYRRLGEHERIWKKFRGFLYKSGNLNITKESIEKFIAYVFSLEKTSKRISNRRHYELVLDRFYEFYTTRQITNVTIGSSRYPLQFNGILKPSIDKFIKNLVLRNYSRSSLAVFQNQLKTFSNYFNQKDFKSISDLNPTILLDYIDQYDDARKHGVVEMVRTLKVYFKFLFDKKIISTDLALHVPKVKKVNQPKIPSVYKGKEIRRLIKSIDKSASTGKRNYAIILLACRLGMRASDITNLKLENIDWEKNEIEFCQLKTSKELILPLLPDVGNAIIDYLKYERPVSKLRYIFLAARPPYAKFSTSNGVTNIVQRAFKNSGIKIGNRRYGPHALRHSLGFSLLKNSTPLHTITEVLGHKNSDSTRYYLRIDLESLSVCMLDVPPIEDKFYFQKGGVLFD